MTYYDPGKHSDYVMVDGQIVERDALAIAERLNDYDENLTILCFYSDTPHLSQAPFVICEKQQDGTFIRVFDAWQLDERILERIYNADTRRHNLIAAIEGKELQIKKDRESRYKERMELNAEFMMAAIKNPTSSFSFKNEEGDLVKIHEDKPATLNHEKKSF